MNRSISSLAACLMTASIIVAVAPGWPLAASRPVPMSVDPRIKQFSYNEFDVYRLDLHARFISSIQFEPGEIVESIQVGDSASWQIIRLKRGDVISVKPRIDNAVTNMTVFTDRRVYTFELRARRARANKQNFRVAFTYPEDEDVAEFGPGLSSRRPLFANDDYYVAGKAAFRPTEVYDDGQRTFFRFPASGPMPAIFRVNRLGFESLVNTRRAGDQVIVDGLSDQWTVRIGEEELCIANDRAVVAASALKAAPAAGFAPADEGVGR